MSGLAYIKDVVTLEFYEDKCVHCGVCLDVCPHEVFGKNGKKVFLLDRDSCMECGACAINCPTAAISVTAGVGCAAAIIGNALGRSDVGGCSCSVEPKVQGLASITDLRREKPEGQSCC